ncbi:MAG: hypothetical protein U1F57_10965 [bacterium]
MFSPIDSLKSLWHEDLVKNPTVHGWVLNLYRAGEKYPQLVSDYFPWQFAPWKELASQMRQHEQEESRHERLLSQTLKKMGQPLVEFRGHDIFNEVIRKHTPVSFRILKKDPEKNRHLKLAHFLAHAHCLEKRVLRSLEYHYETCEKAGNKIAAKAVHFILQDERKHVEYTKRAVRELLPLGQAKSVFKLHRKIEAKANLEFSNSQVKIFLKHYSEAVPRTHRWLYRFCAWVMESAASYV